AVRTGEGRVIRRAHELHGGHRGEAAAETTESGKLRVGDPGDDWHDRTAVAAQSERTQDPAHRAARARTDRGEELHDRFGVRRSRGEPVVDVVRGNETYEVAALPARGDDAGRGRDRELERRRRVRAAAYIEQNRHPALP